MNEGNVAASVQARLLNRARETKQDFNLVLTRYAIERLLLRCLDQGTPAPTQRLPRGHRARLHPHHRAGRGRRALESDL